MIDGDGKESYPELKLTGINDSKINGMNVANGWGLGLRTWW